MVAALLAVAALVAGCGEQPQLVMEPEVAAPPRDGVVIHISHGPEDAHRVLMALQMAVLMAADHDVLVYLDIHGIDVVLADSDDLSFSHFPSSQAQIARLLELGVPVYACPGCLKAAGKTPDDLAPGIQVASTEVFFSFTDGRILTLDY
jgi:predicted peroxiredoxin